jgi:hypothetical protein
LVLSTEQQRIKGLKKELLLQQISLNSDPKKLLQDILAFFNK